jgi:hypothetical protein
LLTCKLLWIDIVDIIHYSIDQLSEVMRHAIEDGTKIREELVLKQEEFLINEVIHDLQCPCYSWISPTCQIFYSHFFCKYCYYISFNTSWYFNGNSINMTLQCCYCVIFKFNVILTFICLTVDVLNNFTMANCIEQVACFTVYNITWLVYIRQYLCMGIECSYYTLHRVIRETQQIVSLQ